MHGDVDIDRRGRGFRALWLFITMKDSDWDGMAYSVKHIIQLRHTFLVLVQRCGQLRLLLRPFRIELHRGD